ncbi:uncharacterized [Tachysurus ichikawai]
MYEWPLKSRSGLMITEWNSTLSQMDVYPAANTLCLAFDLTSYKSLEGVVGLIGSSCFRPLLLLMSQDVHACPSSIAEPFFEESSHALGCHLYDGLR